MKFLAPPTKFKIMEINKQVPNLSLCKKLKELGIDLLGTCVSI